MICITRYDFCSKGMLLLFHYFYIIVNMLSEVVAKINFNFPTLAVDPVL